MFRTKPTTSATVGVAALVLTFGLSAPCEVAAQTAQAFVIVQNGENSRSEENWQDGYLQATGIGTEDDLDNPVKAKAMALQAARTIAQARLVELVEGVAVRSRTNVSRATVADQIIATRTEGTVQHAVVVAKSVTWKAVPEAGSTTRYPEAVVTLRVCMQNFAPACREHGGSGPGVTQTLAPPVTLDSGASGDGSGRTAAGEPTMTASDHNTQPVSQTKGEITQAAAQATGVILNLKGTFAYQPSLSPIVQDPDANVVYDNSMIDRAALLKRGPMQYTSNVEQARGIPAVGGQPHVVDVQNVTADGRLVISHRDAAILRAADGRSELLSQARIAVAQHG